MPETRNKWRQLRVQVAGILAIGAVIAVAHLANRGMFSRPPQALAGHQQPAGTTTPLKPGRPLTILFVGPSGIARGSWVEDDLAAALQACRASGVRLERLAQAGANSRWGEAALARRLAQGNPPDIMVVDFAGNDARLYRGMTPQESLDRHARMEAAARMRGSVTYFSATSPAIGRERIERPAMPLYQQQLRWLSLNTGAGFIDTVARWNGLTREELARYLPDDVHFTHEAAVTFLVPGYLEALSPLVCDTTQS